MSEALSLSSSSSLLSLSSRGADLTPEARQGYEAYKSRRFSDSFHAFSSTLCLNSDPHKRYVRHPLPLSASFTSLSLPFRPTARQLLLHPFVRQIKATREQRLLSHLRVTEALVSREESRLPETEDVPPTSDVEWLF